MEGVTVSVLVPVLNEARHLRDAVARMLAQDLDEPFELLLIDGGSEDGTGEQLAELAAADDRVRVLENPQRRTPFALNVGLAAARGEFVARMDAHTRYPPQYLRLGVARLRAAAGSAVVSVSGPQLAVGDGVWSRRIALALSTSLGRGGATFRRSGGDAEWDVDTGFTGVWRRTTLAEAGGWAEAWLTDQDCELAFRLAEAGGRHICVAAMAAEYLPRDSVRALARQYGQYGFHKVLTFRAHPRAMRPSHLLPPVVALTVAGAAAGPGATVRRVARVGVLTYVGALVAGAARALPGAPRRKDAAFLPLVDAAMHLPYGFGMLAGMTRYGVPVRAVKNATGRAIRRILGP